MQTLLPAHLQHLNALANHAVATVTLARVWWPLIWPLTYLFICAKEKDNIDYDSAYAGRKRLRIGLQSAAHK